jgi:hypothetical protein
MTNHRFAVEQPDRTICFSLTASEAKDAFEWLVNAKKIQDLQLGVLSPQPPMILSELIGGLSAIAENRQYGGH